MTVDSAAQVLWQDHYSDIEDMDNIEEQETLDQALQSPTNCSENNIPVVAMIGGIETYLVNSLAQSAMCCSKLRCVLLNMNGNLLPSKLCAVALPHQALAESHVKQKSALHYICA